eukprot:TRINITY_DN3724_c0_g1_i1.p1 TRINITY_DN3724_c0_g1~~TRINITY_DN3724_c0_g1_i1.p1  ORF type:complete len:280 (+),score=101.90 TRINITY_DN3724_c0_g1_i1:63-902(+)
MKLLGLPRVYTPRPSSRSGLGAAGMCWDVKGISFSGCTLWRRALATQKTSPSKKKPTPKKPNKTSVPCLIAFKTLGLQSPPSGLMITVLSACKLPLPPTLKPLIHTYYSPNTTPDLKHTTAMSIEKALEGHYSECQEPEELQERIQNGQPFDDVVSQSCLGLLRLAWDSWRYTRPLVRYLPEKVYLQGKYAPSDALIKHLQKLSAPHELIDVPPLPPGELSDGMVLTYAAQIMAEKVTQEELMRLQEEDELVNGGEPVTPQENEEMQAMVEDYFKEDKM